MSDIVKGVVIGVVTTVILALLSSLSGGWVVELLGGVSKSKYLELVQQANSAHARLDGIRLTAVRKEPKSFSCGGSGVADENSLTVMYGSKDGTSCKVQNENYFKEFSLRIPNK